MIIDRTKAGIVFDHYLLAEIEAKIYQVSKDGVLIFSFIPLPELHDHSMVDLIQHSVKLCMLGVIETNPDCPHGVEEYLNTFYGWFGRDAVYLPPSYEDDDESTRYHFHDVVFWGPPGFVSPSNDSRPPVAWELIKIKVTSPINREYRLVKLILETNYRQNYREFGEVSRLVEKIFYLPLNLNPGNPDNLRDFIKTL